MSNAKTYESISQSPYGNPYFYKSLYSNPSISVLKSKKNKKAKINSDDDVNTQTRTSIKSNTTSPPPNTPTTSPIISPYHNPYFYKSI